MSNRVRDHRPDTARPSGVGVLAGRCSNGFTSDSLTPKTVAESSSSSPSTKMWVTRVRADGAVAMKWRREARIGDRPTAASILPTGPSLGMGYGTEVSAQDA